MLIGDRADVLAGNNDHRIDRPHLRQRPRACRRRHGINELIDADHSFQVRIQAIHEQGIQHVAGNLCKAREFLLTMRIRARVTCFITHANHQDSLRAQVNRRAQWRRLSHCPVAEIFAVDADRRKDHWHGNARHQVIQVQRLPHPGTTCP